MERKEETYWGIKASEISEIDYRLLWEIQKKTKIMRILYVIIITICVPVSFVLTSPICNDMNEILLMVLAGVVSLIALASMVALIVVASKLIKLKKLVKSKLQEKAIGNDPNNSLGNRNSNIYNSSLGDKSNVNNDDRNDNLGADLNDNRKENHSADLNDNRKDSLGDDVNER